MYRHPMTSNLQCISLQRCLDVLWRAVNMSQRQFFLRLNVSTNPETFSTILQSPLVCKPKRVVVTNPHQRTPMATLSAHFEDCGLTVQVLNEAFRFYDCLMGSLASNDSATAGMCFKCFLHRTYQTARLSTVWVTYSTNGGRSAARCGKGSRSLLLHVDG